MGTKKGLCFAKFVFLTFRGPFALHDSNPYPNRSQISGYNAAKKFGPSDESAAYALGLYQKKNSVVLPLGNEEDLRGTKQAKSAPSFGALLGGHFYYKTGFKMRFLAKMLAADKSNARFGPPGRPRD